MSSSLVDASLRRARLTFAFLLLSQLGRHPHLGRSRQPDLVGHHEDRQRGSLRVLPRGRLGFPGWRFGRAFPLFLSSPSRPFFSSTNLPSPCSQLTIFLFFIVLDRTKAPTNPNQPPNSKPTRTWERFPRRVPPLANRTSTRELRTTKDPRRSTRRESLGTSWRRMRRSRTRRGQFSFHLSLLASVLPLER